MINVDKIVTISLKTDVARQQQTARELATLQLTTEFFLAEKDVSDRARGCFHSHVQVAKNALADEKCQSVLIFEDDVKILSYTPRQINAINYFLKNNKKFDVLYLGFIISKMWWSRWYPVVRAVGAGCHAYILPRRGMEKLASYTFTGVPVDKIVKHDFLCYSIYPIIANQYPKHVAKSASYSQTLLDEGESDQIFWENNLKKQKGILWKNFYRLFRGDNLN